MNEATTTEETGPTKQELAIRAAFDKNIDGGDEEVIKMAMLKAGAKIKSVSNLYTGFMVDSGHLASKEEKSEAVTAACTAEDVDLTTEDGFNAVVAVVEAATKGATTASAANLVRAYGRKNELEVYKKPAGAGRQSGFRFQFYAALKANPAMTATEAEAYGKEHGTENDVKAFSHYQGIRELINVVSGNAVAEAA